MMIFFAGEPYLRGIFGEKPVEEISSNSIVQAQFSLWQKAKIEFFESAKSE